jgi:hypothetical protein
MKKMIVVLLFTFCVSSAFAQATIELSVVSNRNDGTGACWFTYQFTNNTAVTFESLWVKSRVMDKQNQLISTTDLYTSNLRPSKTLSKETFVDNATCSEISRIVVEDVSTCQGGGKNYTDCGEILRLLPGRIRLTTK